MIEFLIELRQYTVYLLLGLFAVLFISFWIFFKSKHRIKVIVGIGFLFFIAFLGLLMNVVIKGMLRSEITHKAEQALKTDSKVLINGQKLNFDSEQLLSDLTKVDGFYFPYKSEAETKYLISIISLNDTLDITLRRDSKRPEIYWVFLPHYDFELQLDRFETKVLNDLNK